MGDLGTRLPVTVTVAASLKFRKLSYRVKRKDFYHSRKEPQFKLATSLEGQKIHVMAPEVNKLNVALPLDCDFEGNFQGKLVFLLVGRK